MVHFRLYTVSRPEKPIHIPAESDVDENQHQRKGFYKNLMGHILHAILLLSITFIIFSILKDTPSPNYFLDQCEIENRTIEVERELFSNVKHLNKAVGELHQIYYYNIPVANGSDLDAIKNAMNSINILRIEAEKKYDSKYLNFNKCVYSKVDEFNHHFSHLALGEMVIFIIAFFLTFLFRKFFMICFVKKEFTEIGWKQAGVFNKWLTCIWFILGGLFLYYLYFNFAEEANAKRHGQFISYFSI